MNLRALQIFQAVCEEGTITKACKKLYMSQPAISHAIHDLEQELQLQLFDRRGKRIYVNAQGKLFLSQAQCVLSSYDELIKSVATIPYQAKIRIGSSITIANDTLPKALAAFKKMYPNTMVEVFVESATHVLKRLQEHQIDIAFVEGVMDHAQCEKITFSSYELVIVCSKKHPLARSKTLSWEDVAKQDWLLREKGSAPRDTFDSVCLLHQMRIEPKWTSVNSQALLQATRENLGLCILPKSIVQLYPYFNDLHILSLDQSLWNENHILYNKTQFTSDILQDLITCIKRNQI